MRFLLTTDEGIEDLVAEELLESRPTARTSRGPDPAPGCLWAEIDDAADLLALGTVHHVIEIRGQAEAETLEDVRDAVDRMDFPELASASSFRVSSERRGEHPFRNLEIQHAAGGVLQGRYGTPVDLEEPALDVRVDLYGRQLVAGLQRTERPLSKRMRRARSLRTALKPTLAVAMLRLAGAHRGAGRLLDPCCGSGTIPVEALRINPELAVFASDWDPETVETARATIANHELQVEVREVDARALGGRYSEPFDYIATNPPYGVRVGRRADIGRLYRDLLPSFVDVLREDGRIVLLALKVRAFMRALAPLPLEIVHERLVASGGLHPRIFVLEPR